MTLVLPGLQASKWPREACRVLVADPPWTFDDALPGNGRGASKHYDCMTVEDICRFELPLLAPDAWLFLWRVGTMQREALDVVRAWGFNDPTSDIVWVKTTNDGEQIRMGMGRTVRNAHEIALVCRRGSPVTADHGVRSVFSAPLGEHSAKPDAFFAIVDRLVGNVGPKVELFSRRRRSGWWCYGNEIGEGESRSEP